MFLLLGTAFFIAVLIIFLKINPFRSNSVSHSANLYINKYTNSAIGYSFDNPNVFSVRDFGSNSPTNLNVTSICLTSFDDCFDPNTIDIVHKVKNAALKNLENSSKTELKINDVTSYKIISPYHYGKEISIYIPFGDNYLLIGTNEKNEKELNQILSTFKLKMPNKFCGGIAGIRCPEGFSCKLDGKYPDAGGYCIKDLYTCPKNGWVDCMPGVGAKAGCEKESLEWYKVNCPNFQGVAY